MHTSQYIVVGVLFLVVWPVIILLFWPNEKRLDKAVERKMAAVDQYIAKKQRDEQSK